MQNKNILTFRFLIVFSSFNYTRISVVLIIFFSKLVPIGKGVCIVELSIDLYEIYLFLIVRNIWTKLQQ